MRLARFGNDRLGLVEGDAIRDVTAALDVLPSYRYPLPPGDMLVANLAAIRDRVCALAPDAVACPVSDVGLRSPLANPGKLVAAPLNYQKHLDEVRANADLHHNNAINTIDRTGLFLKATSSLAGAGDGIALDHLERRTDHEIELAIVIGTRAKRVSPADALSVVAGYCIGLDISLRGPEERSFRKSIDSYTILGPYLVTADEVGSPGDLDVCLAVNGEVRQRSNTKDLILGVPELVAYASSFYTLHPGDVILTGTPEGVGPIFPGDVIDATIQRVGTMRVDVRGA
jgi:2-keto-4-pentenoate hydratase/2-oxohepta-3-ene-1,7-dioic acid hydratase in catechol pathway